MEALKLVQQQKHSITSKPLIQTNEYAPLIEDDLIKLFPSPRYFQIHFQQLHENTDNLKTDMQNLKNTVLEINTKLDLLMQLLKQTHC